MSEVLAHQGIARLHGERDTIKVILPAVALVVMSLLLQCNVGINLVDEGYLWYGAEQTLSGKAPLRDFQSYDPGRYYWCAFWMKIFGNGIISLRLSVAIFQAIGLSLGLLALRQYIRSWKVMVVAGFILLMWMIPRHKLFESSLSMAGVFFALRLIQHPSLRQHFISGVFIGLAAFVGRNHGLYSLAAFGMLALFIRFKIEKTDLLRSGFFMGCGVLVGYSPMLIMMVTVPGMFDSYLGLFRHIASRGATNLTLPVPWPWEYDYSGKSFAQAARAFCIGSFFVILPLVYILCIISAFVFRGERLKKMSLLAASSFVGVMYMHHAFSRAEIEHLAESIAPLLITLLALPYAFGFDRKVIRCTVGLGLLLFMSFQAAGKQSPFYERMASGRQSYAKCDINGDNVWLPYGQIYQIRTVREIDSQLVSPDEGFLMIPWYPAMYPILQRESPLWDIYFLFPEAEARQEEMIEELQRKRVNWVLLHNMTMDGREDRRLSETHKILWAYFNEEYEPYKVNELQGSNYVLLHRKAE